MGDRKALVLMIVMVDMSIVIDSEGSLGEISVQDIRNVPNEPR